GAVEGVLRLAGPEARLGDAPAPPLGDRHAERVLRRLHRGEEPVGREIAADLPHPLGEDWIELDPVSVPVDDRVVETRSAPLRRSMTVTADVRSSQDHRISSPIAGSLTRTLARGRLP